MQQENLWLRRLDEDPGRSKWCIERFRGMAARGEDLAGEARMIDAMVPRGSRILDAGCGAGRVGGHLAKAGHEVVGVDLDPQLVAAARADHPGPLWLTGDLADLDLPAAGVPAGFAVIVCAGNVMTFVAPSTRREILRRFRGHLGAGGRVAVGFGGGRGYGYEELLADAAASRLTAVVLLSSWDLRPVTPESPFLVALLSAGGPAPARRG